MLRRVRSSPDRWVVLVVIATAELTAGVIWATEGARGAWSLVFGSVVVAISAGTTRASIKRPSELDLDPWARYEAAKERLAAHDRG